MFREPLVRILFTVIAGRCRRASPGVGTCWGQKIPILPDLGSPIHFAGELLLRKAANHDGALLPANKRTSKTVSPVFNLRSMIPRSPLRYCLAEFSMRGSLCY